MSGIHRRGMTIREVIIVAVCIAIVFSIASVLLFGSNSLARANSRRMQDATQMAGIHQSWLVVARNFDGVMPTPGLIHRDADPMLGEVPGRGPENESLNTTANLFSACIAQNYLTPEMCVGPTEPSPHVKVMPSSVYNFGAYSPAGNSYWDTNFKADLHATSNVSYAHMPLIGERKLKNWRYSADQYWPILGTRGPLHGVADPNSITNKIFPPDDSWNGNICFADNHVEFISSFFLSPPGATTAPQDNIFNWDTPEMTDLLITFTKAINDHKPIIEHD